MDSIESGKQKMREYFAEVRERQQRPIKVNIPNHQEVKQEEVSMPPQPIFIRQPQRPIVINEPQEKVRFNYPAFGASMLVVSAIFRYLVYTTPSIQEQLYPLIQTIPESTLLLVVVGFLLSCFLMLFIRRK